MAEQTKRSSAEDLDVNAGRNGQHLGQESPLALGLAALTQSDPKRDPAGQSEAARLGSDVPGSAATGAETPPETLKILQERLRAGPDMDEAIDRATAAVGQDDGKR